MRSWHYFQTVKGRISTGRTRGSRFSCGACTYLTILAWALSQKKREIIISQLILGRAAGGTKKALLVDHHLAQMLTCRKRWWPRSWRWNEQPHWHFAMVDRDLSTRENCWNTAPGVVIGILRYHEAPELFYIFCPDLHPIFSDWRTFKLQG